MCRANKPRPDRLGLSHTPLSLLVGLGPGRSGRPVARRVAVTTHYQLSVRDIETREESLSTWGHGPGGWMFSPDGKWLITGRESVRRVAIPE